MMIRCTPKGMPSLHILPAMVKIYVKKGQDILKCQCLINASIKVSKH